MTILLFKGVLNTSPVCKFSIVNDYVIRTKSQIMSSGGRRGVYMEDTEVNRYQLIPGFYNIIKLSLSSRSVSQIMSYNNINKIE